MLSTSSSSSIAYGDKTLIDCQDVQATRTDSAISADRSSRQNVPVKKQDVPVKKQELYLCMGEHPTRFGRLGCRKLYRFNSQATEHLAKRPI